MNTERDIKVLKKRKNKQKEVNENTNVFDIPVGVKVIAYIITTLFAVGCILPFLLTVSISITDESVLEQAGYSLIPEKLGFQGYEYVLKHHEMILKCYGNTIFITVVGTLLGLLLMTMYSYVISRKQFPLRKLFTIIPLITMLFSGGMLGSYMVNTNILHLQDTIWALILPSCMTPMYVLILRTFMSNSVPSSVLESAKLDGASEFICYARIVVPMAVPAIATIALFMAVNFWNDWQTGFLYIITNNDIMPIQLFLKRIEDEVEILANATMNMNHAEMSELQKSLPSISIRMCLVVIVVLPILMTYPFFQRFFIQGITVGAVKE